MGSLYIFLDEGGNLDFSPNGTRYFSLSCVTMRRPFVINTHMDSYKYDCIEWGLPQEYFHCADDNAHVRQRVFGIVENNLNDLRIDTLIVEKASIGTALRVPRVLYSVGTIMLLEHVILSSARDGVTEVIVVTDTLPVTEKRRTVEKSIKRVLSDLLPPGTCYRLLHHASRAHYGLQIADYCNWAVFRKWERDDAQYYNKIFTAIKSERAL